MKGRCNMPKLQNPQILVEDVPAADSKRKSVYDTEPNDIAALFTLPQRFANIGKLVMRDLNNNRSTPTFYKYSKDNIANYLKDPYTNAKNLRDAAIYMYNASAHFRRLIRYFVGLSDLSYVVSPHKVNTAKAKPNKMLKQFNDTANFLASMDLKKQGEKILTVVFREDTGYYTTWLGGESIIFQQLPSDYCDISVIEDNVFNVTFNFSYFDANPTLLPMYPKEFAKKYKLYQKDNQGKKWQELDSPTSFAIKCNDDIPAYPVPPFAGIFRDIYDIEDYRGLKLSKTELENYAMLVMQLGVDKEGNWEMPLPVAKGFYNNLSKVLPEEVGAVLSPMPIDKIDFDRSGTNDTNHIAEAEQQLYTAAGVSALLFNNVKASSNALLLSIKVDQALTYSVVKSIEGAINRLLHAQSFGKNFKVTFLDCSPFNRKELSDGYLKACNYGIPMLSYYAAAQGMSQQEMDGMNFLEDSVLNFKERFTPLKSSSTLSKADSTNPGRPTKDVGDLTDSGEASQETNDGDND